MIAVDLLKLGMPIILRVPMIPNKIKSELSHSHCSSNTNVYHLFISWNLSFSIVIVKALYRYGLFRHSSTRLSITWKNGKNSFFLPAVFPFSFVISSLLLPSAALTHLFTVNTRVPSMSSQREQSLKDKVAPDKVRDTLRSVCEFSSFKLTFPNGTILSKCSIRLSGSWVMSILFSQMQESNIGANLKKYSIQMETI